VGALQAVFTFKFSYI